MEQTILLYPSKGHADAVCQRKGTYSFTFLFQSILTAAGLSVVNLFTHALFFSCIFVFLGHSSSQFEPNTLTDNQRGLEGLCV